jgi:hypothetical protein
VAAYPEHRGHLLDHLLSAKLRHWDKPTRSLAARALAALAPAAGAPWTAARALPALLGRVTDDALEARCGAVRGVAELLPALAAAGVADLDAAAAAPEAAGPPDAGGVRGGALAPAVAGVLGVLSGAGLYRGKGGELMREAAARLVECTALAVSGLRPCGGGGGGGGSGVGGRPRRLRAAGLPRLALPLGPEFHAAALALVEDCLCHPLGSIRASGAAALAAHARAHAAEAGPAAGVAGLARRCLARLRDPNTAHRRGAAEALGALPAAMLAAPEPGPDGVCAAEVVGALCAAAAVYALPPDERDVEARVAAVEALGRLAVELHSANDAAAGDAAAGGGLLAGLVVPALLAALRDYTTDNRGDVGSWARAAAADALAAVVPLALAAPGGGGGGAGAPHAGKAPGGAPRGGSTDGGGPPDQLRAGGGGAAGLAADAVRGLLRLSVERIARLREGAAAAARALLEDAAVRSGERAGPALVGRPACPQPCLSASQTHRPSMPTPLTPCAARAPATNPQPSPPRPRCWRPCPPTPSTPPASRRLPRSSGWRRC